MKIRSLLMVVLCGFASNLAMSQSVDTVVSKSRDAASAFIGTTNFVVGRIGRDCLVLLGRPESANEFVGAWQQRNTRYYAASVKYMVRRLEEALAAGGAADRDAVAHAYGSAVRREGEATVERWFQQDSKEKVCGRVVSLIDAGAMDVNPKLPIFTELEALAAWAQ